MERQEDDLIGRLAERLVTRHMKREDLEATLPPSLGRGRYQLRRPVARAPYGRVFIAYDTEQERPVLIRLVERGRVRDEEGFLERAAAVATFADPGVVPLLDAGLDDGRPFFVHEAVFSRPLSECVLSVRARVGAVEDAARTLHEAHGRGLVHGDLNPSNILVGERVLLRDLGQAALVVDERAKVYLGQLEFLAPEQVSGGEVGPWTDVHALGAVLFFMLTGRTPFEGGGVRGTIERIRREEAPPPSDFAAHVPPELERVVMRALAKNPDERYVTAIDFARELFRFRMRTGIKRLAESA